MRLRALLIVVVFATLGFAPAPFPKTERQRIDPTDITGTWEFVRWEISGHRYERNEEAFFASVTKENFAIVVRKDGSPSSSFPMRLDPAASPPAFTWSRDGHVAFVGSYRLQKNEMTMILAGGDNLANRPTDFEGKPTLRFILKRVKR
jgi:uncharacterized protein (TIGR03067 family)